MDRRKALALGVLSLACGTAGRVRIGGKNFVEQDILAHLIHESILRFANASADLRLRLGGSLIAHNALLTGDLDAYPEYSGTALTACLKLPLEKGAPQVFERVRQTYLERHQVHWGWPLGFSNQFAIVARAGAPFTNRLSDACRATTPWRFGVGYEFQNRPDGWQAMRQVYPLPLAGDLITMDLGLLYRALDANQVDLIAANSTDPLLASGRYRVLEDDRSFFPPYETCIAARQSALARWPKLGAAFDQLQGRVNESAMRRLNAQVVLQGRRADEVAREFAQTLWGGSNHG